MIKPGLKIGIALTLMLVLPTLFFSAYEMGNLSQNEMVVDSIYSSQLESILFSVNQYSDDVVSSWAYQLDNSKDGLEKEIRKISAKNYSIDAIAVVTSRKFRFFPKEKIPRDSLHLLQGTLERAFSDNHKMINNLQRYIKSGYQKIGVLETEMEGKSLFAFARKQASESGQTILFLLNTLKFVNENLGPKIQGVAQNRFYISVFESASNREIYANAIHEEEDKNIQHKKDIWLLPGYQMGIQMKGNTVEDLVHERTTTNFILLGVMNVVLLLGAWFVFRNIRQQIRLNQMKSEFISNVSHEIRTPLALINMYSETLEMGRVTSDEKRMEYYRIINTETNRLSSMVNKILNFGKIESGRREYHFQNSDLNSELDMVLQNYRQHLDRKGFALEFSPGNGLPIIAVDREALSEAVINLIDNAVKYSDQDRRIAISTGKENGFVFLQVTDYGIGIAPKDQALVFDKFYRVTKGDLAHKAKGSGIGLSIVKHIMEAHKGNIELRSRLGEGSCFGLYFPVNN
ncbi:MAG: sensor histidine kinase [Marinifilaceae bacterium]